MGNTLTAQTVRGGTFTFGASLVNRLLGVVGTIYLVRTLTPEDFGLFTLAFAAISSFELLSGLGTGHAVVQSTSKPVEMGIAALTISTISGLLMLVLLVQFSDTFAILVGTDQVSRIVVYLSPLVLAHSIRIIPAAVMQKNMQFGRRAVLTVVGDVVNTVVSVAGAALGQGFWCLVYGALSRSLVLLVLTWNLSGPKEWFRFELPQWSMTKDLLSFGSQFTLFGLLKYFTNVWHNLLVGRVLGPSAVGYYSRAFVFSSMPSGQVLQPLSSLLFSAYAKLQGDPERLQHAFLRSIRLMALVTFPSVMGLCAIAEEFVQVVLGATWAPMTSTLQALSVMNVFVFFSMVTSPLYLATGAPRHNVQVSAIEAVSTVLFTLVAVPYGIFWVACASTVARGIGAAYSLRAANIELPGILPGFWRVTKAPLIGCAVMILGIWVARPAIQMRFAEAHSWGVLVSLILLGAALYLGTVALLDRGIIGVVLDVWKQTKRGANRG